MTGSPLVSVIMTSFNSEAYISEAIQSMLNQTLKDWELLIADDCSTDGTRQVISRFKDDRIIVSHNSENQHYLRTRNRLLSLARGKFIALLDSDDVYEPQKLQLQVDEFLRNPVLAMCGTLVSYMDKNGAPISRVDNKPISYAEIKKAIREASAFTGSSIMVRTEVLREFGGYRDFFSGLGFEDYDLTSRIVEKYVSINISESLYRYRQYPESTSRKGMLQNLFKLNGHLLIQHFIGERATTGKDSLDRNDISSISNFIAETNRPYIEDPSRVHREVMWSYLHRKMIRQAYFHALTAFRIRPFMWANLKALILLILISSGLRRF